MDAALQSFIDRVRRAAPAGRALTPLPEHTEDMVRQCGLPAAAPADGDSAVQSQASQLVSVFSQAAARTGAAVVTATQTDWMERVAALLERIVPPGAARRVVATPSSVTARLQQDWPELESRLVNQGFTVSPADDDDTLFQAVASITGVACAIAETGTIVWHAGPKAARGATLIPPVHVAVVGVEQLVPDLHDYFVQLGLGGLANTIGEPSTPAMPAHLNLITGPSKTADIEGVLVTGVHGPGQVHIVVVAPP